MSELRLLIKEALNKVNFNTIKLPVKEINPLSTQTAYEEKIGEVKTILENLPKITYDKREWLVTKEDALSLLSVENNNGKNQLMLDKDALDRYTDSIALQVDNNPTGEVLEVNGERVIEFRPQSDGEKLEKERFKEDLSQALLSEKEGSEVKLDVTKIEAPEGDKKYGIYALLGEGVSYYSGSIPGRIKNLGLSVERATGVLVAPGDTYSFNKTVGEISFRTGYDAAYIIQNGRTVLGEGGGVCQSSTTVFRAALNAGLPIVKRTAHAYRVYYYEENSEPGLDATVFSPSVDLQFKNDTPGYILLQSENDLLKHMLKVRIYGTPDGRTIEISKPVVTNVSPPPEPLYEDTDRYNKGSLIQIDHAAWGATVTVKRTVKRNNEVLSSDTFVSRYQPWKAVYQRGTR